MRESFRFAAKDEEIILRENSRCNKDVGFSLSEKNNEYPRLAPAVARRTNPIIAAVLRPNNRGLLGAIADRRAKSRAALQMQS